MPEHEDATGGTATTNEGERRRWNDELWTSVWPRRELLTSQVTSYLLDSLRPAEGERVLEIGSGGGSASFPIAEAVGSGSVTGADLSVALCELARRRAAERGVANARFLVADAQHEQIPGAPFDAATSQFGVMFFEDPRRAFANIRAHLVPGGRLAFACWCEPARNPWIVNAALAPFLPAPPAPAPGKAPTGPFSLADAGATAALLEAAGWVDVAHRPHELVVTVDLDAIFDENALRFFGVPEDRFAAAREAVEGQLRAITRPDGRVDAPLAFQVFTATSPA